MGGGIPCFLTYGATITYLNPQTMESLTNIIAPIGPVEFASEEEVEVVDILIENCIFVSDKFTLFIWLGLFRRLKTFVEHQLQYHFKSENKKQKFSVQLFYNSGFLWHQSKITLDGPNNDNDMQWIYFPHETLMNARLNEIKNNFILDWTDDIPKVTFIIWKLIVIVGVNLTFCLKISPNKMLDNFYLLFLFKFKSWKWIWSRQQRTQVSTFVDGFHFKAKINSMQVLLVKWKINFF